MNSSSEKASQLIKKPTTQVAAYISGYSSVLVYSHYLVNYIICPTDSTISHPKLQPNLRKCQLGGIGNNGAYGGLRLLPSILG
jgi:hypothetical protein